jgi:RNA polymerase sigma-70 factor (ECF subfamily)
MEEKPNECCVRVRKIMIAYQRIHGRVQSSDGPNCKDPDSELVVCAQAGDRDAFERLVLQHKASISRVIFRITKNREDAEDEVQETFLRAYHGLREFRGNSKFITWLTRIAVNRALMCLRKRRPRDISFDDAVEYEGDSLYRDIPEWRPNPEQCYSQREVALDLNEELTALPHDLRSALILKLLYGYTTGDIAKNLGISVPAVKSRVLRARRRLGVRLRERPVPHTRDDAAGGNLALPNSGRETLWSVALMTVFFMM